MWESRSDFQGRREARGNLVLVFRAFHRPAFPRPVHALRRRARLANSLRLAACICCAACMSLRSRACVASRSAGNARRKCRARSGNWRRISHGVAYQRYTTFLPAFGVGRRFRHAAGTVKVEMRIEVLAIEPVEGFGVHRSNVAVANMLADHPAVFRFGQPVVVAVARARLGLLGQQLVEQRGHLSNAATRWLMNSLPLSE